MKTIEVTSPTVRGEHVKEAQRALKKSKFGSFYGGQVDGQYGPITGNAAADAKWLLGYEKGKLGTAYGQSLHTFLTGKAELTPEMASRRKTRLKTPPAEQKRKKMLQAAITKIGVSESPSGSNVVQFSRWYGMTGPWCAMFVTWAGCEAGLKAFERSRRWAYCPYMVSDALAGRNGLRARGKSEPPRPGDVVLFDWTGDGVADHVGIFEKGSRSTFTAIEGNTSYGNNSNGGAVMRRSRSSADVRLFCYAVS